MAEHGTIRIPDHEYKQRVQNAAALMRRDGLDVMFVNSTESDYANARYFTGYWPVFERSGCAISAAVYPVVPESRGVPVRLT